MIGSHIFWTIGLAPTEFWAPTQSLGLDKFQIESLLSWKKGVLVQLGAGVPFLIEEGSHTHTPKERGEERRQGHSFFIAKLLIQTFIHFISWRGKIRDEKGALWQAPTKFRNQESVISSARLISGNLSRHQANLIDQGNLTGIIVCLVVLLLPWASIPNSLKWSFRGSVDLKSSRFSHSQLEGIELKALTSGIPQQIRKASAGVRKTSADITKNLSRHQEYLSRSGKPQPIR
jgi:hypothetical protein